MANELLASMLAVTAAATIASLAVLALRRALRHQFGAEAAYRAWLMLPVAALAVLLPSGPVAGQAALVAAPLALAADIVRTPASDAAPSIAAGLLLAWLAVALLALAWQVLRYRAFVRGLGAITSKDGFAIAAGTQEGPLLLGVLRPVVVVPGDFHQRYTSEERELILAHERTHARRMDPIANALCALAQCVWWFNPVIHLAASRFRLDQELACDHAVMKHRAGQSRTYAQAMLKTQLSSQRASFACQWQSLHPLKERILNLNRINHGPLRRIAGQVAVALLLSAGGWSAWAAQGGVSPGEDIYEVDMRIHADGQAAAPKIRTRAGEDAAVRIGPDGKGWHLAMKLTPSGEEALYLHSTLTFNGAVMSKPVLLVKLNEAAAVQLAQDGREFRLDFTVRKAQSAR